MNNTSKVTQTGNTYQYTGLTDLTKYTLKVIVRDKAGNMGDEKILVITTGGTKDFAYTGGEQKFSISESGKYKLEVWGAQGGGSSNSSYIRRKRRI